MAVEKEELLPVMESGGKAATAAEIGAVKAGEVEKGATKAEEEEAAANGKLVPPKRPAGTISAAENGMAKGASMAAEEEKGATAVEEEVKGATAVEEAEKGATAAEEEEMGATAAEEAKKGATAAAEEEKGATAAEEEEMGATAAEEEEKGATAAKEEEKVVASGRKIIVKSWEGKEFTISGAQAWLSDLFCAVFDSVYFDKDVVHRLETPLNVRAGILEKVLEYCSKHAADTEASDEELEKWDRQFFDGVGQDVIYDLLYAANYLCIEAISDACCKKIADMMKGMTLDDFVKDYFTEAEEQMTKECSC